MKSLKILFIALLLTGCSNNSTTSVVNDKLINGYSYPVEGGISSNYTLNGKNVMTFYNVKTNNLFSICTGDVKSINTDSITVKCKSGEEATYMGYALSYVELNKKVVAGEKIADLPEITRNEIKRYRVNIIFSISEDGKEETLSDVKFFEYIRAREE